MSVAYIFKISVKLICSKKQNIEFVLLLQRYFNQTNGKQLISTTTRACGREECCILAAADQTTSSE